VSLAVRAALASQPQFASFAVSYWFSRTKRGVASARHAKAASVHFEASPGYSAAQRGETYGAHSAARPRRRAGVASPLMKSLSDETAG